jgi:hypothetical protein
MQVAAHFALGERHQARGGDARQRGNAQIQRLVVQQPAAGRIEQVLAFGTNVGARDLRDIFGLKRVIRVLHWLLLHRKSRPVGRL